MCDIRTELRLRFLYYIYSIMKKNNFGTIIKSSCLENLIGINIRCFLINGFRVVLKSRNGILNNLIIQHENKNIGEYRYGGSINNSYVDNKGDIYEIVKDEQVTLDDIVSVINENLENLKITGGL